MDILVGNVQCVIEEQKAVNEGPKKASLDALNMAVHEAKFGILSSSGRSWFQGPETEQNEGQSDELNEPDEPALVQHDRLQTTKYKRNLFKKPKIIQ